MFDLISGYENLWKAIIRPPKDKYTESDLGLINYSQDRKNLL